MATLVDIANDPGTPWHLAEITRELEAVRPPSALSVLIPPRHAMSTTIAHAAAWTQTRVAARWRWARALYAAALELLERVRLAAPVRIYGPEGKTMVVTRGTAELLARQGKLRRAPDEVMRQELGLPPRIEMTEDTDHTAGSTVDGTNQE